MTSTPLPTPKYEASFVVVFGRITPTKAASQIKNQKNPAWEEIIFSLTLKNTLEIANNIKINSTIWMVVSILKNLLVLYISPARSATS